MGLNKSDGFYRWSTGQNLSYEMWGSETAFSSQNVYGEISFYDGPKWLADWSVGSSHLKHGFVCQYNLSENHIDFSKYACGTRSPTPHPVGSYSASITHVCSSLLLVSLHNC